MPSAGEGKTSKLRAAVPALFVLGLMWAWMTPLFVWALTTHDIHKHSASFALFYACYFGSFIVPAITWVVEARWRWFHRLGTGGRWLYISFFYACSALVTLLVAGLLGEVTGTHFRHFGASADCSWATAYGLTAAVGLLIGIVVCVL